MKIQKLVSGAALALTLSGCALPVALIQEHQKGEARKQAHPFQVISDGAIPVNVGQAPAFSPSEVKAIAVIVTCPDSTQRPYWMGPSPLLPPHRKSMIETAVDQELLAKGYRVAARSDVDSLLMEIGFQNTAAVQSRAALLASDRGTAQLGRMLKVDAVAIVRLNQAESHNALFGGTTYSHSSRNVIGTAVNTDLAVRLVVVRADEALWIGSQNVSGVFRNIPSLDAACATSARAIISKIPEKPRAVSAALPGAQSTAGSSSN